MDRPSVKGLPKSTNKICILFPQGNETTCSRLESLIAKKYYLTDTQHFLFWRLFFEVITLTNETSVISLKAKLCASNVAICLFNYILIFQDVLFQLSIHFKVVGKHEYGTPYFQVRYGSFANTYLLDRTRRLLQLFYNICSQHTHTHTHTYTHEYGTVRKYGVLGG